MKICRDCQIEKPLSEFHKNTRLRSGVMTYCKPCQTARHKLAALKKTPEELAERQARYDRRHGLKQYGITEEQYEEMLARQGGVCATCRQPSTRTLHVDHDHTCCPQQCRSCGECIRGLLCRACNLALGYLRDDPETLKRMIKYLAGATKVNSR